MEGNGRGSGERWGMGVEGSVGVEGSGGGGVGQMEGEDAGFP